MSDEQNHTEQTNSKVSISDSESSDSGELNTEIEKLQNQIEKYKNDYLYLRAEFENYRKNMIKERSDLLKFGGERIVRDLLGVLDNFERALSSGLGPNNFETFKKGVEMTAADLKSLLNKHGVTEIPADGVAFDPNIHEALASEPTEAVEPGKVVRVFQRAYKLHEKLIRPAQVVVAKKPE